MSNCPCCGATQAARHQARHPDQHHSASSSQHESDDALLADDGLAGCSRLAQRSARERGAAAVEVADFVVAMTMSQQGRAALTVAGLEPDDAFRRSQSLLAVSSMTGHARQDVPHLGQDLLTLLERAEAHARRSGADAVTLTDFGLVLARESGDLASARGLVHSDDARNARPRQTSGQQVRHWDLGSGIADARRHRADPFHAPRAASEPLASTNSDPFQLRVDAGRERASAAPMGHTSASTERERPLRADGRRHVRHAQTGSCGCEIQQLAHRFNELAAARDRSNQERMRQHAAIDGRLDTLSRELAALKEIVTDAFATVDGRLTRLGTSSQSEARDDTADRLGLIEAALARLEATVTRAQDAQSLTSNAGRTDRRRERDADAESGREADRDGDFDRRSDGDERRASTRTRSRFSGLSRRRRRRSSSSSQSSRTSGSSRQTRTMRAAYDSDRDRSIERDRVRQSSREDRVRDDAAIEDEEPDGDPATKRFYLAMTDDVVDAPSIGPRTASRLYPHGIRTVADLLTADAADLAERIGVRYITTGTIEDWQMQARLVCTIPWLRGTHAQLLVGSGYTSAGAIQEATGDALSADILKFAATREGQRILRNGPPPPLERIAKWAAFADLAELDRAA